MQLLISIVIVFYYLVNDETDNGLLSTQTNNIHIIVGAIVCTCIVLTIGVVIFIYILRYVYKRIFFTEMLIFIKLVCSINFKLIDIIM